MQAPRVRNDGMTSPPVIGIVGSAGAYGRWLCRFFVERMGLAVLGHDPSAPASDAVERLLAEADVLLFAAPIRVTEAVIADWTARSAGAKTDDCGWMSPRSSRSRSRRCCARAPRSWACIR